MRLAIINLQSVRVFCRGERFRPARALGLKHATRTRGSHRRQTILTFDHLYARKKKLNGHWKIGLTLIALMLGATGGNYAAAASPLGLWRVISFQEPDLTAAGSRELCFRANGTFFEARPNPNEFFTGFWFKKGDRIRFVGTQILTVDLGFQGRTANFGQFINNSQFAGEFHNLIIQGNRTSTLTGNFIARRLGPSC